MRVDRRIERQRKDNSGCGLLQLTNQELANQGRQLPDFMTRRFKRRDYITGGTVIPITASVRINSRRTTATVVSRNCLRASSGSLRMGWRW